MKGDFNADGNLSGSAIIGASVRNQAKETVRKINDVFVDKSGAINAVVVSVDGFLGVGSKDVAVKWADIQFQRDGDSVVLVTTWAKGSLKAMPDYKKEIFYPACKAKIADEDVLDEAYVEHDGAKVLIAELLASEPDADFYDAKVKVLSELIKHHVKEEEKRSEGLFAQARAAGLDVEALGARLAARKKLLLEDFDSGDALPPPEPRSYSGHELKRGYPESA